MNFGPEDNNSTVRADKETQYCSCAYPPQLLPSRRAKTTKAIPPIAATVPAISICHVQ